MKMTRRSLMGAAAGVSLAGTLAACSTGTSGGTGTATSSISVGPRATINFGYIADFNGTSLLAVANDQKLWDKYNINASTKSFTNGPLQIQALGTGDLQFGYIGPGAMWLPASGKAKVVAINATGTADRVIAQPGITSIADLRGKKVAVPEGTSGDMILQLALQKNGMTIKDVQKVAMDASTVVSAFASKQVDAAGIWYPLIGTIKQQVPDLVELAKNQDFIDVMAFPNVFVSGPDYPTQHEDVTVRVLKVLRDAMDWRAANMDQTIQLVAKMNNVDAAKVKDDAANGEYIKASEWDTRTTDGTVYKWLDAMNNFFVGAGKLTNPLAGNQYYLGDLWVKAGK